MSPRALPEDPGLGASPILNVHVWYDRPVMDEPFTAVVDGPAQWIFNRTAMGDLGAEHHLAVSISGAREEVDVPRADLAAAIREEVELLYPRARAAELVASAVVKEPQATFAAAPGQGARRPGTATALPGVALAGAWTATGWPATMEGAVRSGIRAARHVPGGRESDGNGVLRRFAGDGHQRSDRCYDRPVAHPACAVEVGEDAIRTGQPPPRSRRPAPGRGAPHGLRSSGRPGSAPRAACGRGFSPCCRPRAGHRRVDRVGVREATIMAGAYGLYTLVKGLFGGSLEEGRSNAQWVIHSERTLGIYVEARPKALLHLQQPGGCRSGTRSTSAAR